MSKKLLLLFSVLLLITGCSSSLSKDNNIEMISTNDFDINDSQIYDGFMIISKTTDQNCRRFGLMNVNNDITCPPTLKRILNSNESFFLVQDETFLFHNIA